MDRSRCSATAASATDPDEFVRDSAAGNATGSNVSAARALAVAGTSSSDVAASPADSAERAVVVPVASCCSDASCCHDRGCCCRDGHPSFDRDLADCDPNPGDVAVPPAAVAAVAVAGADAPNRGSVAAAGAVAANADHVPAIAGSDPAAVARQVVAVAAGAVVPNAVAV